MGTPLPPNEPGEPCEVCWGPGKPFGDPATPKYISMQWIDYFPGDLWDEDLESILLLPQLMIQTAFPCTWAVIVEGIAFALGYETGNTALVIQRVSPFEQAFRHLGGVECLLTYPNEITTPAGVIAYGGKVVLTWTTKGLS